MLVLCRGGTPEGRKVVKWNVEDTFTWLRKQNAVYEDYLVSRGVVKFVVLVKHTNEILSIHRSCVLYIFMMAAIALFSAI